jgi:hypothetical protein
MNSTMNASTIRSLKNFVLPVSLTVLGFYTWSSIISTNKTSQLAHASLFKGIMFHLRHDATTLALLGESIKLDGDPTGILNNVQGVADIRFGVRGDKGGAGVVFKGRREGESDLWEFEKFVVKGEKDGIEISM